MGQEGRDAPGAQGNFRADTPDPNDGRLARRSRDGGGGGVLREGSGRSGRSERGRSRKEVRWSRDVDYEGR